MVCTGWTYPRATHTQLHVQPNIPLPLTASISLCYTHCKDKIPKFRNKYSQKRSTGVSVPISKFMCLWVIYIFPGSVCLFCWRKFVDRSSWDYINPSQTHECGNWGWGRAIPRKEIHKWDFRCSAEPDNDNFDFLRWLVAFASTKCFLTLLYATNTV